MFTLHLQVIFGKKKLSIRKMVVQFSVYFRPVGGVGKNMLHIYMYGLIMQQCDVVKCCFETQNTLLNGIVIFVCNILIIFGNEVIILSKIGSKIARGLFTV